MRIIAGEAKGHTLKAPKGRNTRPTQDRVRESIFNVLANYGLHGITVLDLFSGTGAMALEALSRGAAVAVTASVENMTDRLPVDLTGAPQTMLAELKAFVQSLKAATKAA